MKILVIGNKEGGSHIELDSDVKVAGVNRCMCLERVDYRLDYWIPIICPNFIRMMKWNNERLVDAIRGCEHIYIPANSRGAHFEWFIGKLKENDVDVSKVTKMSFTTHPEMVNTYKYEWEYNVTYGTRASATFGVLDYFLKLKNVDHPVCLAGVDIENRDSNMKGSRGFHAYHAIAYNNEERWIKKLLNERDVIYIDDKGNYVTKEAELI